LEAAVSVSKRLRFEILKRDGFRCKYCGRTAVAIALEVDHVVPVSEGGTDEPENLITACFECNRGKGAVPLDESRIQEASPLEAAREHTKQIKEYLRVQRALDKELENVRGYLAAHWKDLVGHDAVGLFRTRLLGLAERYPLESLISAMKVTGSKGIDHYDAGQAYSQCVQYFYGVLRRRDRGADHESRIADLEEKLRYITDELAIKSDPVDQSLDEIANEVCDAKDNFRAHDFMEGMVSALFDKWPNIDLFCKYHREVYSGHSEYLIREVLVSVAQELGGEEVALDTEAFWLRVLEVMKEREDST